MPCLALPYQQDDSVSPQKVPTSSPGAWHGPPALSGIARDGLLFCRQIPSKLLTNCRQKNKHCLFSRPPLDLLDQSNLLLIRRATSDLCLPPPWDTQTVAGARGRLSHRCREYFRGVRV